MKITLHNQQKSLKVPLALVKRICKTVAQGENETFDEVAVFLVSKEEISRLHDEYFEDPTVTDCITFPLDGPDEEYRVLGDIFVCPEVAIEYAKENNLNPLEECALYIVHGMLHLFGYDDIKEKDRKVMKQAEKRYMEILFP